MRAVKSLWKAFCLAPILSGCEAVFFEPAPKNNPESNFDTVWKDFDEIYAGFDARKVTWDSAYNAFRPQIDSKTSETKLFNTLNSMLTLLKDAHVVLRTKSGQVGTYSIANDGYPKNFLGVSFVQDKIIPQYKRSSAANILYGLLPQNVGYIYIKFFSGNQNEYLIIDQIMMEFQGVKGVIVDVRDNGGGSTICSDIIANRFADQKRIGHYFRWKNGPDHNDLSDYDPSYVEPDGALRFTGPVVVLTNRKCFSATEYFISHMKALPHVTQIGGVSGGGSGVAYTRDLPNGWTINVPRTIGYNHKKESVERVGFVPDLTVTITPADEANGFDRILQAAIDQLK